MSNQKMREALESLHQKFTSGNDIPVKEARITRDEFEALAQQPVAGVELTDREILDAMSKGSDPDSAYVFDINGIRAVIAAHEAKKAGGGV